ncbi:MAG: malP 2 [Proteobacteria bacterium]|nr:malP 2 [Pseudomonadota bacterium]
MNALDTRVVPPSIQSHAEDGRTALGKEALKRAFLDNLFYVQGKFPALATRKDYYMALAYVVRDRMLQRWISTAAAYTRQGSRTVAYLSAEFLMGPHLGNNLINLGIRDEVKQAMGELGLDFDELLAEEEEPGLGNGGLGRLAACFLDSLATLEIPTLGYGIRYEFGIFDQEIVDGWQVERTDKWLRFGNPARHGRHRHALRYAHPRLPQQHRQHPAAVARRSAGILRLRGVQPRRLLRRSEQEGVLREPHQGALSQRRGGAGQGAAPGAAVLPGFLLAAGHAAHHARANGMDWDEAWDITRQTFAYTNHTLLPEALERWPLGLFGRLLPRHLEIILDINARFLDEARIRFLGDEARIARLSLIDESGGRHVRMAHLACVGSHAINGVAALHTELLKQDVLQDFHALWPDKVSNKTNGVTPRRWVVLSNPKLSELITDAIGDGWIKDLEQLRKLEPLAADAAFQALWRNIKRANKQHFAAFVRQRTGIAIDPESLFDVQVKRIHEYKRQHLNILHVIALYCRLRADPRLDVPPRTFIFGGKAAPGYHLAKLIIKLINAVGDVVNRDPAVRDRIKVVFLPNYNVSNGQRVYPAADLSEQISTAGKEASGTGNMKFSMNGALTIGTLDGANIEIRDEVGAENFFLFGLTAAEVCAVKAHGYRPEDHVRTNPELREVIDLVRAGFFSRGDTALFRPLVDGLLHHDPYLVLADYQSYVDCQSEVSRAYVAPEHWTRMSILNAARSGKFSSDRTIREYCEDIWRAKAVPIRLLTQDEVKAGILQ